MEDHATNSILYLLGTAFRSFSVTGLSARTLETPDRYAVFRELKQERPAAVVGLLAYCFTLLKEDPAIPWFFNPALLDKSYMEAANYINNGINERRIAFLQYMEYKVKVGASHTATVLFLLKGSGPQEMQRVPARVEATY